MSSILRKLTGAVDEFDDDEALMEENDIRENLKNRFAEEEEEDEPEEKTHQPSSEPQQHEPSLSDDDIEGALTIDVYQTENDIVIVSTIAGVTSKDLDVSITNDMVTISGQRRNTARVKQENYFYQECYWGPFSRSVILPIDVDAENAGAELKDGVLNVILPKSEKVKSKKIPIK